jgi:hypothetical protein
VCFGVKRAMLRLRWIQAGASEQCLGYRLCSSKRAGLAAKNELSNPRRFDRACSVANLLCRRQEKRTTLNPGTQIASSAEVEHF